MRIGIDARKLDDFGIGTYIRNLVHHLAKKDTRNTYILFCPPHHEPFELPGRNFSKVIEDAGKYSLKELVRLPFQMKYHKLDLFHAPHYTLPPLRPCKAVVTIHDVIHLRFPQYLPSVGAYYYAKGMMFLAARSASKIITVSQFCKKDIVEILKVPETKVEVIYNGVAEVYRWSTSSDFNSIENKVKTREFLNRFGITGPYLLYVGNFMAHKNLKTLMEAYRLLKDQSGFHHQLVLVGDNRKGRPELENFITTRQWQNEVILTGFVPWEWLPIFYRSADLFVFPSLYEGFGLPVLEAMACGVPVVASNRSSLPEIIGEAGVLVNPESPQEIAQAIWRVLSDSGLRTRLIRGGLDQARRFSWEETARKTLAVYQSVLTPGG
ncbi:MAG TPA: glycosyltransferase family 1 protein [Candidatus Limnocylindrales bacterium]|nr:glycosyltransferase family 1 protein [Candidatus Limnocylindrales bacterium]